MVEALIETYWQAKTERADVTRALYRSVTELDNDALIRSFAARADRATEAMFASARDVALLSDVAGTNLALTSVIYGTVRNAFERGLDPAEAATLRTNLLQMCRAYLKSLGAATGPAGKSGCGCRRDR